MNVSSNCSSGTSGMPANELAIRAPVAGRRRDLAEQRQRHGARSAAAPAPAARPRAGEASVTGLVREPGSSGVVATAVPITDVFAHVPLWNCAGPHALLSFFRSSPSIGGSATSAIAVEPWPSRHRDHGLQRRERARPWSCRARRASPRAWARTPAPRSPSRRTARTPWRPSRRRPSSVARTACSAQLDALRMNPGRSSVSANDRIDTGTPPISRGSGDVCTVRPPSGRSLIDAITVTVPRSTGPTLPGRTIWQPGQAAVLRAGEETRRR